VGDAARARLFARSTALLAVVTAALILAGSAAEMSRTRDAVATTVTAAALKADGDRRLAAGDVVGALQAYDDALMLDPADVGAYYRAGVALSHLDDREQAAAMFLQVVRAGEADDEEVRRARAWLKAAGVPLP
jgi:tetratricopeptide (TPR) repeat protein